MKNYFKQTKDFEEQAFNQNKDLLIQFMGGSSVVSTDYLSGDLVVLDRIGIDKVFECPINEYKTTSLRIRNKDYQNITLRGHLDDPYSQTRKIYNIQAKGSSYADYTLQVNGVDPITYKANSTLIRVSNRHLSGLLIRLEKSGLLERYWLDKGQNGRFYEFTYETLQKYSVFPYIVVATTEGMK